MSQAITSALRRIEHDLALDRGCEKLDIPVDRERHERLLKRRTELHAERDRENHTTMAVLERFEKLAVPPPQETPILTPMGPDESVGEVERRESWGQPHRTLPTWM